jgi:hypothetical protein
LAFVIADRLPDDIVEAVRRKLVLEIAGKMPPGFVAHTWAVHRLAGSAHSVRK